MSSLEISELEILADWMRQHGFSTGQAYTTKTLLDRLGTEMVENTDAAVLAEREECAKVALSIDDQESVNQRSMQKRIVRAIRARGDT